MKKFFYSKKMIFIALLVLVLSAFAVFADPAEFTRGNPEVKLSVLNYDPSPARAGDVLEVRMKYVNDGGKDATNFWAEFVPEYPFLPLDGDETSESTRQVIDVLPCCPDGEDYKILTFKMKVDRDAAEGVHKIKFRSSMNTGFSWETEEFPIEVTAKEVAEIIYIDKTKIIPGKKTDLVFTVNNLGNAPLKDLVFYWDEPGNIILPVGSDNTRHIKYLEAGQSIPLKYEVMASVNANPDLYMLNLNLEYDRTNGTEIVKEKTSTKAGVFVGGETDFDISFSESTQGQTSLSVANVGSNPALSVTVSVPQQDGFRVQGTNTAIVGNLDKGDYTIVSFNIMSNAGSNSGSRSNFGNLTEQERQNLRQNLNQNNNLKVLISYTDTTGERQKVEKNVSIQFRSLNADGTTSTTGTNTNFNRQRTTSTSWNLSIWIPIILVLLVAGIFVYYKKRKDLTAFFRNSKR
ncbi:hypothetical protein HZA97_09400 [Candidatus Woesearchaeota archaeon]|nr:hypothetical protein [Candidatus Woesearchaeota archaeon]